MDQAIEKTRKRMYWVDLARFILIFAVVFGHTVLGKSFVKEYIYSFHVPGFIIISGFFVSTKYSVKDFVKNRIFRILIPYLIVGVISILVFAVLGTFAQNSLGGDYELDIWQNLKGLLYGNSRYNMKYNLPLWYLPFIFLTEIISFLIIKLFNRIIKNKIHYLLFSLFFFVIGYIYNLFFRQYILPFNLENVIQLIGFFFLGYGSFELLNNIKNNHKLSYGISIILVLLSIVIFNANGSIDYAGVSYSNYWLFVIGAIFANVALFLITPNVDNLLTKYGKSTLFIMLFHKFPILVFQILVPYFSVWLKSDNLFINTTAGILISLITIALCLVLEKLYYQFIYNKLFLKKTSETTT